MAKKRLDTNIAFDLQAVTSLIGYKFKNPELLLTAFTHSSYANEHFALSYERLEFLGDSILSFIVSTHLFKRYVKEDEGFLSKARAQIVSKKALSLIIHEMGLIKYLRVTHSQGNDDIRNSQSVRSDLFEAILAAVFLDGGMKMAEKFVMRCLHEYLDKDYTDDSITDFKTRLLEYATKNDITVSFNFEPKPKESFEYVVTINLNSVSYGVGSGFSKKKAEQNAAKQTLLMLGLSI